MAGNGGQPGVGATGPNAAARADGSTALGTAAAGDDAARGTALATAAPSRPAVAAASPSAHPSTRVR